MELKKIRSKVEFETFWSNIPQSRWVIEKYLSSNGRYFFKKRIYGFCTACKKITIFKLNASDSQNINFRENLVCPKCKLCNRQRFVVYIINKIIKNNPHFKDIYILEQVTCFYSFCKNSLKKMNIVGSEFLGHNLAAGELVNGIRNENILSLSLKNKSMDMVVSNDVFEHVPSFDKAILEIFRVLKDNGMLVFSVPFYAKEKKTKIRSFVENNKIVNLYPQIYHGNPLSSRGSLVCNEFGWDIFNVMKRVGFKDFYILSYYSLFYGNIGGGMQYLFIAEK